MVRCSGRWQPFCCLMMITAAANVIWRSELTLFTLARLLISSEERNIYRNAGCIELTRRAAFVRELPSADMLPYGLLLLLPLL